MTDAAAPATDLSTLDARKGSARFDITEDGSSYTAVRVFGAPPERVFRAFTDPADLRVWFPAGAPDGSTMPRCESDPVVGGRYHYEMVVPGFGEMSWRGTYTGIDRPGRIDAEEWFTLGAGEPEGPPTTQTLTFEALDGGMTRMTMEVFLASPEDPEQFMEQSAAGLSSSLTAMDELVSA